MPGTIKVLLLAADSGGGSAGLRLDHEIRGALEAARMGRAANELEVMAELAVGADDVRNALLRHNPQIVHFAGHAKVNGLILDDGTRMSAEELAGLLSSFRDVRVVVLNACDTLGLAETLSEVVDYTVGMELPIDDDDAIGFSAQFYAALAFGRTIPFAFDLARKAVNGRQGQPPAIPHLLVRPGADERPLEGKTALQTRGEGAEADDQVIRVADTKTSTSAELGNRSYGVTGPQVAEVSRSEIGGSLKITNTRRK